MRTRGRKTRKLTKEKKTNANNLSWELGINSVYHAKKKKNQKKNFVLF